MGYSKNILIRKKNTVVQYKQLKFKIYYHIVLKLLKKNNFVLLVPNNKGEMSENKLF